MKKNYQLAAMYGVPMVFYILLLLPLVILRGIFAIPGIFFLCLSSVVMCATMMFVLGLRFKVVQPKKTTKLYKAAPSALMLLLFAGFMAGLYVAIILGIPQW